MTMMECLLHLATQLITTLPGPDNTFVRDYQTIIATILVQVLVGVGAFFALKTQFAVQAAVVAQCKADNAVVKADLAKLQTDHQLNMSQMFTLISAQQNEITRLTTQWESLLRDRDTTQRAISELTHLTSEHHVALAKLSVHG